MLYSLLCSAALASDPTLPAPDPSAPVPVPPAAPLAVPPLAPSDVASGPAVQTIEVDVLADPGVVRARAKLFQDLKDQGYRKGDHRNDRTVFKPYVPYHPRVIVHDDGWVYLEREPPRVHVPGRTFADQGAPANYLWCILAPTACISIGGWMIGPRKYQSIEGEILDSLHQDVNDLNEAVARKQLELRVNTDIPTDCEQIWSQDLPEDARRRLLYTFWDTRLDNPDGDYARQAIMAFIRGVVMQSSAPFTVGEIDQMHTHRHCTMAFEPRLLR
ncbi:MAG: hypothetical protein EXR69_08545 [Myxococcales bacterium]|nr:hypothetical protein [Myxococcales bacterium]